MLSVLFSEVLHHQDSRLWRRLVIACKYWYNPISIFSNLLVPFMSPRFSHVFQFGQRWLNWLKRQPPDSVGPVVMETMVKIMACCTSLMGGAIWRCPDPECNSEKRVKFPAKVEAVRIVQSSRPLALSAKDEIPKIVSTLIK